MSEQKPVSVNDRADAQSSLNVELGWLSMETAPKDGRSVHVIPECGYNRAFFQDGRWWWHTNDDSNYAAGSDPKGWLPIDTPNRYYTYSE